MNDTPETDAAFQKGMNGKQVFEFAERLERERDEARELADRYRVAFCSAKGDLVPQAFPWEAAK